MRSRLVSSNIVCLKTVPLKYMKRAHNERDTELCVFQYSRASDGMPQLKTVESVQGANRQQQSSIQSSATSSALSRASFVSQCKPSRPQPRPEPPPSTPEPRSSSSFLVRHAGPYSNRPRLPVPVTAPGALCAPYSSAAHLIPPSSSPIVHLSTQYMFGVAMVKLEPGLRRLTWLGTREKKEKLAGHRETDLSNNYGSVNALQLLRTIPARSCRQKDKVSVSVGIQSTVALEYIGMSEGGVEAEQSCNCTQMGWIRAQELWVGIAHDDFVRICHRSLRTSLPACSLLMEPALGIEIS
jgi:hypothetical protein